MTESPGSTREKIIGICVLVVLAGGLGWQILKSRAPVAAAPAPVPAAVSPENQVAALEEIARQSPSPENYLNLSLAYDRAHRYGDEVVAAQHAIKLRPNYAEAWNNIAAAYLSMNLWDEAIESAQRAVDLKPEFPLARNNLAYAKAQKAKAPPASK